MNGTSKGSMTVHNIAAGQIGMRVQVQSKCTTNVDGSVSIKQAVDHLDLRVGKDRRKPATDTNHVAPDHTVDTGSHSPIQ